MIHIKYILVFGAIILTTLVNGQIIKTVIEKHEYKIDETIEISFETDVKVDSISDIHFFEPDTKVDSIGDIHFSDFEVIQGPSESSSISITNGKAGYSYEVKYSLRALKSGKLIIDCPLFFISDKVLKGEKTTINIIEEYLTSDEKFEIRFNKFIANSYKPNDTFRYVIKDDIGYIEIFEGYKWQFYRKLTKKEIKAIRKIK